MNTKASTDTMPVKVQPWKLGSQETDERLTIRDAVKKFMISRMNCGPKTHSLYFSALKRLIQFMEYYEAKYLDAIDADLLEYYFSCLRTPMNKKELMLGVVNYRDWMDEDKRCKTYEQNYVHGLYRPVNTMVRYFQARGDLPLFNYVHPLPDNKSYLWSPSDEEFFEALNACLSDRDYLILLFMGDSALRAEETMSIDWGDIYFDEAKVRVRNAKWGSVRDVTLSKGILELLQDYKNSLPEIVHHARLARFLHINRQPADRVRIAEHDLSDQRAIRD